MTYKEVEDMVSSMGLPNAYYEFVDETERVPPFICFWFPESDDFFADDQNYIGIRRLYIELYTDEKDFALDGTVEGVLTANGITYRKSDSYIDSEKMWQTLYEMEVIIDA